MNGDTAGLVGLPTVSVIIAAFSLDRWDDLRTAVESVKAQTAPALETVVVIDYNPCLLALARREFLGISVIANGGGKGASGARNTGVAASHGEVVAFLDDDAVASTRWLEALLRHFNDASVLGVGGRLEPLWAASRPRWFPPEFDWAVGASYRGMPVCAEPVRNVWSGNMAIRRSDFGAIGGFREGFGKVGTQSRPEDTDLCLRAAARENGSWIYEPAAAAGHRVPGPRSTLSFFLSRCFHEGRGKAALAALNGVHESTSAERKYTGQVLPRGIVRGLTETLHGDVAGGGRSLAIAAGLAVATAGFVADRIVGRIKAAASWRDGRHSRDPFSERFNVAEEEAADRAHSR